MKPRRKKFKRGHTKYRNASLSYKPQPRGGRGEGKHKAAAGLAGLSELKQDLIPLTHSSDTFTNSRIHSSIAGKHSLHNSALRLHTLMLLDWSVTVCLTCYYILIHTLSLSYACSIILIICQIISTCSSSPTLMHILGTLLTIQELPRTSLGQISSFRKGSQATYFHCLDFASLSPENHSSSNHLDSLHYNCTLDNTPKLSMVTSVLNFTPLYEYFLLSHIFCQSVYSDHSTQHHSDQRIQPTLKATVGVGEEGSTHISTLSTLMPQFSVASSSTPCKGQNTVSCGQYETTISC